MVLERDSLAQRVSATFSDTVLQLYLQLIKKNPRGSHKTLSIGGVAYGLTEEHVLTNLTYEGNGRSEGTERYWKLCLQESLGIHS